MEEEFREYLRELNFKRYILLGSIGCVLYLLFWLLDWVAVPDYVWIFLRIRVLVSIIVISGIIPFFKRFSRIYINLAVGVAGLGIGLMIRYYGGSASPYYAGLCLVLLAYSIAYIPTLSEALFFHWFIISSYVLPSIFIDRLPNPKVFIQNTFFLVSTSILGLAFSCYNYFSERRLFYLNKSIEEKNRKLMELDELKSRFFNNITHELRTPLTMITVPLENLLQNWSLSGEIHDQLEIIYNQSLRLLKLVNSVLDLSKIDSGAIKLHCVKDDFNKFIKYLADSFMSMAAQKNININFRSSVPISPFPFDKDKIEHIFVNLIFNAIKFTPARGYIQVETGIDGRYAYFYVKDTGIGIAKDKIPLIFDRFTQVYESRRKEFGGTGLGLAIVKELVELHQGRITVESELNRGTKFTVLIPMDLEETGEEVVLSEQDKVIKKIYKKALYSDEIGLKKEMKEKVELKDAPIVMAIDDNPDMLSVINSTLQGEYNVILCNSSVEGLKKALDTQPDIVISDLMMPGMDGIELCECLKKEAKTKDIPFILLTAKADLTEKIKSLQIGADDYIFKPFHPAELKARIKVLLRLRESADILEEKSKKLEELTKILQDLAITDPLTGVYNRRHLYHYLGDIISTRKYPTAGIMVVDIDHFKTYNDTKGHLMGDSLLKRIIEIMRLYKEGLIFRYGGDEFIIIMPGIDKRKTLEYAEDLRKKILDERLSVDNHGYITLSIGVGAWPDDGFDIDSLLANIDRALYKAKGVRNKVAST